MKTYQTNEKCSYALLFGVIALFGCFMSILNLIPLIIGYQLIQLAKAEQSDLAHISKIEALLYLSALFTLCFTVLYLSI